MRGDSNYNTGGDVTAALNYINMDTTEWTTVELSSNFPYSSMS